VPPRVGEEGAAGTCVGGGRSRRDLMELDRQPASIRPAGPGSMSNRRRGWRPAPRWLHRRQARAAATARQSEPPPLPQLPPREVAEVTAEGGRYVRRGLLLWEGAPCRGAPSLGRSTSLGEGRHDGERAAGEGGAPPGQQREERHFFISDETQERDFEMAWRED